MDAVENNYGIVQLSGESIQDLHHVQPHAFDGSYQHNLHHRFMLEHGAATGSHYVYLGQSAPGIKWRRASAAEAVFILLFAERYNSECDWEKLRTASESYANGNHFSIYPVVLLTKRQGQIGFRLDYPGTINEHETPSYWLCRP